MIGNRNTFREFCTVHRGSDDRPRAPRSSGTTTCSWRIRTSPTTASFGNRTVFANGASLAGHCVVGDDVILGAFAAVRQFLRIGPYAFVGAYAGLNRDVLPFLWSSTDRDVRA